MNNMSRHSSMTPIESAWFSAVHSLSASDLQQLVGAHGNHLLGLQKSDPTDFEDVETSTEAQALLGADTTGMTAVHIALIMGEPQDSSVSSNSPHSVLAAKRLEVLTYLIDASSTDQLRLRWGRGNTALHLASFLGETDIIKALLSKGLPTHLKNELAFAPIDVAHDDATSDAFRSLVLPPLRGEHRRLHSTSSSASSSFKRTESNASAGSFSTEEPLSTVLQNRIAKQQRPVTETMLPPSPSTSPPPASQSMVETERPLTFTGKYIRPPPDEDISSATTTPGSPLTIPAEQGVRAPLKGPKRRVVGVDLTLFDDVLGDSSDGESVLPVPLADTSTKRASTPAMEQLSTKSLVSNNPFFQREKSSSSSTPPTRSPIKPLSFRAASPSSTAKAASQESTSNKQPSPPSEPSLHNCASTGNSLVPDRKQTTLAHQPVARQTRASETQASAGTDAQEEVDRSAPDYTAIRATFAKMTVENPQAPKNPTERLANVFAMAAVNGDPTRRKWKAASTEPPIGRIDEDSPAPGHDSLELPQPTDASVLPKSSPAVAEAKRPHQKSDSGVEREGLPSVWSQAQDRAVSPLIEHVRKEEESISEQQESLQDESQEYSKLVSVDSGLGVKDGDTRATTDFVTIQQQPASTLAPPSLLLDLDLDLSFDDLESCLGFSEAIDSTPLTTASPSALSREARPAETVAPATQFEKHAAVLVAASKLAEANQPPRTFETTPIPRQSQSRYSDVSSSNHTGTAPQFGGAPMPNSPRRSPVTVDTQDDFMANRAKSRSASVATNATAASMTAARPASPRGRKQVTFTPGAEPSSVGPQLLGPTPAVGTTPLASNRTSGLVTLKVSQIGGLEWVLAERQMCYVLVSVSKDSGATPVFTSRPLLVLSDKVTLHEEASFDLNASDGLFVEVKLRFERRQQAKSSIFSGFKFGKRDDQVKDVKEEMLARQALNPVQVLSRAAGSVETEEFLVASSKSIVSITVSTMVMPPTLVAS